ncbi:hypothetical protein ABEI56_08505 [Peribacillus castrilensis]|uniref:Uncharacterized protein n=1 Tax=Peribacillus frigoritolerans TaxID=450367 RepID=A0AAJ1QP35_9BACI|nr:MULTISPECIES: hypothetical protein [Bacillaceae]MDM5284796.1 hypothetical protein [Peribacillus frigoritolerans]MEA3574255.1 hypothetical protein [Peribacillus frigoritolerans]
MENVFKLWRASRTMLLFNPIVILKNRFKALSQRLAAAECSSR